MTVWIVVDEFVWDTQWKIHGVYATKEAAQRWCDAYNTEQHYIDAEVAEWDVQE